ncbi:MarR family winged helix-turn-helix transcriptional regulator [Nocardia suismassiliense]|uniref:MarR family winged helix-turn-helix transcriptional regulator n=1 Tax=Nocardia suismassiliense TaxID=2077092 RepID=UPI00131EE31F|nr:MarR family transcriptional regulator [Nocardia suismassiliense]
MGTDFTDGIAHQLRRASQSATTFWQLQGRDLTAPQFSVLAALTEYGAQDQTSLGKLTSIDKSTLATLVDRLSDRGLIDKTTDPANRRRRRIQLTDAGRDRCARAYAQAAATEQWITDVLGDTDARQLRTLLQKLGDAQPPTRS